MTGRDERHTAQEKRVRATWSGADIVAVKEYIPLEKLAIPRIDVAIEH